MSRGKHLFLEEAREQEIAMIDRHIRTVGVTPLLPGIAAGLTPLEAQFGTARIPDTKLALVTEAKRRKRNKLTSLCNSARPRPRKG